MRGARVTAVVVAVIGAAITGAASGRHSAPDAVASWSVAQTCSALEVSGVEGALRGDVAVGSQAWLQASWAAKLSADLAVFSRVLGGPAAPVPFGNASMDSANMAFAVAQVARDDSGGGLRPSTRTAVSYYSPLVVADFTQVEEACAGRV